MIQRLPTEVISQIAAAEVIDSGAAVVRELAENAIDAQATRIAIAVTPDHSIQLTDNGWGMELADLQQAALAHSTSKVSSLRDLQQLNSLGFRGNALFSLAQLANLTITSRAQDLGWQIVYDSTGMPASPPRQVAIAPGTSVKVEDLFSRFTLRQQSQPSWSQQLRQIQIAIQELAIAQPQISWQAKLGKQSLEIYAGQVSQVLTQVIPGLNEQDLGTAEQPNLQITCSLSDRFSRVRPDWIKVVLNGRVIDLPELNQVILQRYSQMLPRQRYPVCVVSLNLPPEQVDWHRQPHKRQVYVQNLGDWQAKLDQLILQVQRSPLTSNPIAKITKLPTLAEPTLEYAPLLKAIAQVQATYILAEHSGGIYLVEQHVAHERVLFEQIEQQWQMVTLDSPVLIELTTLERDRLDSWGFRIEPFGKQNWLLRTVPQILQASPDLIPLLTQLAQSPSLEIAKATAACNSAIRNGTALSLEQMQNLLNQWHKTQNPRTCPHGRPICLSLDNDHLARFFRRNWLVKG
ncbi:MAG: DNA mismatch repair endonuclease MutL [Pseudanabaenaceae cyanobacterium bins.68]|nr:DNA mismatch repair endonuclease MutL [Pseudanabaenaceae cyanobacterium bins.68]